MTDNTKLITLLKEKRAALENEKIELTLIERAQTGERKPRLEKINILEVEISSLIALL